MDTNDLGLQFAHRAFEAGRVFTPGSPLDERDLFSGRQQQIHKIIEAISQKGYHSVLYGDRGVGKMSLSNVLVDYLSDIGINILMPRANCDASDTFSSLWLKALRDVTVPQSRPGLGFTSEDVHEYRSIIETIPDVISPDDVRRTLTALTKHNNMVIIFDEFDRLINDSAKILMADTIKTLSDHGVDATILLIGVADSVDRLIEEHHSVERALVQVHLPRMSDDEVKEIFRKGLGKLNMSIDDAALDEASSLSQGLPYVTHLLALHSARESLKAQSLIVKVEHVHSGVQQSISQWQQSVISTYYAATKSHQPGNIFKEVLTACALAEPDELGFFTAAAVRLPLKVITGHNYDIPNFARHLNEFAKSERGPVLQKTGETRRIRYRFVSPLIRPYVTMRAVADGILDRSKIDQIQQSNG